MFSYASRIWLRKSNYQERSEKEVNAADIGTNNQKFRVARFLRVDATETHRPHLSLLSPRPRTAALLFFML